MKSKIVIGVIISLILTATTVSTYAGQARKQGAQAGQSQQSNRPQQTDRDRAQTHDQMQNRDRTHVDDMDRQNAKSEKRIRDQDIYGSGLMSDAERNQYRNIYSQLQTQRERDQFQLQHETQMRDRAMQQGKDLVPPGQGQIYGGKLMSVQERNEYREKLRWLKTDQEKAAFEQQHRQLIKERSEALDLKVDETE